MQDGQNGQEPHQLPPSSSKNMISSQVVNYSVPFSPAMPKVRLLVKLKLFLFFDADDDDEDDDDDDDDDMWVTPLDCCRSKH